MAKQKKFDHLSQLLKQELAELPPGTAVMSVREMMRRHQVSQVTVTRALRQLRDEGLIESSAGRRTRRAGNSGMRTLVFLESDYSSTFGKIVRQAFEAHFCKEPYRLKCLSYDHQTLRFDKAPLLSGVDAVIFNISQDFTAALLVQLAELPVPVVFIDILPQTLPFDAVCTDNDLGGAMAAEWFLQHGHRRCAFLQSTPCFHSSVSRRRAFLRQLMLNGCEGILIDAQTRSGENSTAKAYYAMRNYFEQRKVDFTALFCDSDLGALGALKACHDFGIEVPGALNIIGYDNIPEGEFFHPALSTMDQNVRQWAVEAESIISARLDGNPDGAIQRYVTPQLILRESTS